MAVLTKEYFEEALEAGFEKQAVLINNAFQAHSEHFDKQINGLDLKIGKVETSISGIEARVDRALHTEYVNLEVRVKRLEHHTGLKST